MTSRRTYKRGCLAAVLLALGAVPAVAQQIRGTVRDSASGLPIPGAPATLIDSSGASIQAAVTNQQGRFVLVAHSARDLVRVVHIGHQPRTLALPAPDAEGVIQLDVRLSTLAISLDAMRIQAGAICPARADQARALTVWQQAQAGLLAVSIARDNNSGFLQLLSYQRNLELATGIVLSQVVDSSDIFSSRSFTAARPAADFAELGYADRNGHGAAFLGPDVDVLLDERFAASHCLRLEPADRAHPGQIGIGFVPIAARPRIVDIAGILWLDAAKPQLRTLEYGYTNVAPAKSGTAMGGTVVFRSLANGIPLVERWIIRTSPAHDATKAFPAPNSPLNVEGRADAEGGAELMSVVWSDSTGWQNTLGGVVGEVHSVADKSPVAGIRVALSGTDYSTTTDASGSFALDGILPGTYRLLAFDEFVAPFDLSQNEKPIIIDVGRVTGPSVSFNVMTAAQAAEERCRHKVSIGTKNVVGRVVFDDGTALPLGTLALRGVNTATSGVKVYPLNDGASFVICGVALGTTDTLVVDFTTPDEQHRVIQNVLYPVTPHAGKLPDTVTYLLPANLRPPAPRR